MKPLPLAIFIIMVWTLVIIYSNYPRESRKTVSSAKHNITQTTKTRIIIETPPAYEVADLH